MCKLKKLINNWKIRYYNHMMSVCVDGWDYTRVEYGEDHKECQYWVKRFDYYKKKLNKISSK